MTRTWRDNPVETPVEGRDETLRRIAREERGAGAAVAEPAGVDPSTRRGLTRRTLRLHLAAGLVAGAVAFVVAWLVTGGVPSAVGVAAAVGLVASVLVPQLQLEREDGRVADEVAARTGRQTPPDQNA